MKYAIRYIYRKLRLFLFNMGFDVRKIVAWRHYFKYRAHKKQFQQRGGVITHRHVILEDFNDQAGSARGHYFHQDLLVASLIFKKNPARHVDVGSRVDGFVAHVAAFRPIEVIDVRHLATTGHQNIIFTKADLMDEKNSPKDITDSLSCLHAIEHFGLGRYGDPVDPQGHIKGFRNLIAMLKPHGTLYISMPIGLQNEVHFNAHRVFHPHDILSWGKDATSDAASLADHLRLERFDYVDDNGDLHQNVDLMQAPLDVRYGCGIYTFVKLEP